MYILIPLFLLLSGCFECTQWATSPSGYSICISTATPAYTGGGDDSEAREERRERARERAAEREAERAAQEAQDAQEARDREAERAVQEDTTVKYKTYGDTVHHRSSEYDDSDRGGAEYQGPDGCEDGCPSGTAN